MAIDLTKFAADSIIAADDMKKSFTNFLKDFRDQQRQMREEDAKQRAMDSDVVREAIRSQAQRAEELQKQFLQEGMSPEEQEAAKDQARKESQLETSQALEGEKQRILEEQPQSDIGSTFSILAGKFDNLLGISEKANKLSELRNDISKKGLVQTIRDSRERKAEAERQEALEESGGETKGGGMLDAATGAVGKVFQPIGKMFKSIAGLAKGAFAVFLPLLGFLKALDNPQFRDIVVSLFEFGKTVLKETFDGLMQLFDLITNTIVSIVDKFKIIFDGDTSLSEKMDALFGIFKDLGKLVFDAFNVVTEKIANIFGVSFAPYDGLGDWIVGKVKEVFTTVKNWFAEKVEFLVDGFTSIKDWITNALSGPVNFVKDLFSWPENPTEFATKLLDIVLLPYNLAINFLRSIFGWGEDEEGQTEPFSMGELIVGAVNSAIDWVKGLFGWNSDEETTTFSFSDFLFGEDGVVTKIIDWIKGLFDFELPDIGETLGKLNPFNWFGGDDEEDVKQIAKEQMGNNEEPSYSTAGEAAVAAEDAMIKYQQTGDKAYLEAYQNAYQQAFEMQQKAGNQQYEMLMKKMEENGKLTDDEKQFINQYNIMNGGNNVSSSSSTGFSTKKSAMNDDYSYQLMAGSMP